MLLLSKGRNNALPRTARSPSLVMPRVDSRRASTYRVIREIASLVELEIDLDRRNGGLRRSSNGFAIGKSPRFAFRLTRQHVLSLVRTYLPPTT